MHPKRVAAVLVEHYEKQLESMEGKAMVVCMSRRICIDLYHEIVKIRPEWSSAQEHEIEQERQQGIVAKMIMTGSGKTQSELDFAVRQLVAQAITAEGEVIDVFTAAGLKKPDISILSEEFLAEVKGLPQKNLADNLLQRLLKDEIKVRFARNVVRGRTFSHMLQQAMGILVMLRNATNA